MEYTEHEKIKALEGKNELIGEFLEWLQCHQYHICHVVGDHFCPKHRSIEEWLCEFFNIDAEKLEMERQQMLQKIREINNCA